MFIHINNMNFSLVAPSRARKKIIEKQRMELMKKAAETKPFLLLDNRIQVNDTDSDFFSCSSVRLTAIVEYVNNRHMLPDIVDPSLPDITKCSTQEGNMIIPPEGISGMKSIGIVWAYIPH